MPIHDQGYARYTGARRPPGRAWWVIGRNGIRQMFSSKLFLLVLLFAWMQFFVRGVVFYLAANFPQVEGFIAPTPATFRDFFDSQAFFVFVVAIYTGAGAIANDRQANALPLYLARPLTRWEYVAGKLAAVMVFLLLITWVQALLLLVLQTMFTGSLDFVREHAFLLPAVTAYGFLQSLVAGITIVALSSLSTSARYVGILYAGAVIFTGSMFTVLRGVTGSSAWSWISFTASQEQVGDVIFGADPRYDTPWGLSLLIVVALIALSVWILGRRVRGVEVVS